MTDEPSKPSRSRRGHVLEVHLHAPPGCDLSRVLAGLRSIYDENPVELREALAALYGFPEAFADDVLRGVHREEAHGRDVVVLVPIRRARELGLEEAGQ